MVHLFSFLLLEDSLFRDCCKVDGGTGSHFFARQANFQAALGAVPCARAPPACTAQGREQSPRAALPSPALLCSPAPPSGGLLCASHLVCLTKTCEENEMGPNQHYCPQEEPFSTLLPFLHNRGGRFWKSRTWAAVRYLKVMTNIWKFVLQGLTHLYKFWVRLPGVSPVASKELYLFTLAKNLALYFLICPHLSPPPVALVLPGLFFCH